MDVPQFVALRVGKAFVVGVRCRMRGVPTYRVDDQGGPNEPRAFGEVGNRVIELNRAAAGEPEVPVPPHDGTTARCAAARVVTCDRTLGHVGSHGLGHYTWNAEGTPLPRLCGRASPELRVVNREGPVIVTCDREEHHQGPHTRGEVSWGTWGVEGARRADF